MKKTLAVIALAASMAASFAQMGSQTGSFGSVGPGGGGPWTLVTNITVADGVTYTNNGNNGMFFGILSNTSPGTIVLNVNYTNGTTSGKLVVYSGIGTAHEVSFPINSGGTFSMTAGGGGFMTNCQIWAGSAGGGGGITLAQATAAAQANNLNIPPGGTMTNRGSVYLTNGNITIDYGATKGSQTGTSIQNDGGIITGGYVSVANVLGINQIGQIGVIGAGSDVDHCYIAFANSSGGPVFDAFWIVSGGVATNTPYPHGWEPFMIGDAGQIVSFFQTTPADTFQPPSTGGLPNPQMAFLFASETNNPPIWTPTNVIGMGWNASGVFNIGAIPNPTFNMNGEGFGIKSVSGTNPFSISLTASNINIGNGGLSVMVSNATNPNSIVGVGFSNPSFVNPVFTNSVLGSYTNSSSWLSNSIGLWIYNHFGGGGSHGLATNANLIGTGWTNSSGFQSGYSTAFAVTTNTYYFAPSNASPYPASLTNRFALNTVVSNSWTERWQTWVNYGFPATVSQIMFTNATTGDALIFSGSNTTNAFSFQLSPGDQAYVSNISGSPVVLSSFSKPQ